MDKKLGSLSHESRKMLLWRVGVQQVFNQIVITLVFLVQWDVIGQAEPNLSQVTGTQLTNDGYGHCPDKKDVTISSQNEDSFCTTSGKVTNKHERNYLWDEIEQKVKDAQERKDEGLVCTEKNVKGQSACRCYTDLVTADLKPFSTGITKDMIDNLRGRGTLYQILEGKLYREKSCKFPVRCTGIEHFLKKVAEDLPNMEFVINVSDWPVSIKGLRKPLPIFSFSKNMDYTDISYPAWTFWEGGPAISLYPRGVGRWDLMRKTLITTAEKIDWSQKVPIGFFRGSRTSNERDALVLLSHQNPDLVDAQYTKNQAWRSDADTLNFPAATEVSFEKHCDYKFLFNYRGVAASFRFKHLFLCKSLVFHVGNEWTEFFYHALKPWVHYIPVPNNADQYTLKSFLEFFIANDSVAYKIAENGYTFVKSNLKLHHITCYWKELLSRYGKLLNYQVASRTDLIRIE